MARTVRTSLVDEGNVSGDDAPDAPAETDASGALPAEALPENVLKKREPRPKFTVDHLMHIGQRPFGIPILNFSQRC